MLLFALAVSMSVPSDSLPSYEFRKAFREQQQGSYASAYRRLETLLRDLPVREAWKDLWLAELAAEAGDTLKADAHAARAHANAEANPYSWWPRLRGRAQAGNHESALGVARDAIQTMSADQQPYLLRAVVGLDETQHWAWAHLATVDEALNPSFRALILEARLRTGSSSSPLDLLAWARISRTAANAWTNEHRPDLSWTWTPELADAYMTMGRYGDVASHATAEPAQTLRQIDACRRTNGCTPAAFPGEDLLQSGPDRTYRALLEALLVDQTSVSNVAGALYAAPPPVAAEGLVAELVRKWEELGRTQDVVIVASMVAADTKEPAYMLRTALGYAKLGRANEAGRWYSLIRSTAPLSYEAWEASRALQVPLVNVNSSVCPEPTIRERAIALELAFHAHSTTPGVFAPRWEMWTRTDSTEVRLRRAAALSELGEHVLARRTLTTVGLAGWTADGCALRMLYPAPSDRMLEVAASEEIDPSLMAAVVRQESMWERDARSPVGATGLMQLMPATAAEVAKSLKIAAPRGEDLTETHLNMRLGARYLSALLRTMPSERHALAGYNAGPTRVRRWNMAMDTPQALLQIPIHETRDYVRQILLGRQIYRELYPAQVATPGR